MAFSRRALGLITAFLIVGALAGGIWLRLQGESDEGSPGAQAEGGTGETAPQSASEQFATEIAQSVVGVAAVRDTLWITVSADGQATAFRMATLSAQVRGPVVAVPARENDPVAAGRSLIRIDSTEYSLAFRRAQSELRKAQAEYQQRILFDDEAGLDQTVREERAIIARSISGLDQAEVALAEAQMNLDRTRVSAPFGGRVADLRVVPGQYVTEGTELATVVDLDPIKVEANVLEADLSLLGQGRAASVEFTALPGEVFNARIETINPLVDRETGTARVTLQLPNHEGRIKPGMFARVRLDAQFFADRLLVPREAILERDRRTMLFVAHEDAGGRLRAEWRYVTTGRESETMVELVPNDETSMVEAGEIVLVDGHHYLVHDAAVMLEEGLAAGEGRPGR